MADWRRSPLMLTTALVHAILVAVVIASPHRWPLALTIAIANHLAIVAACMVPRSPLLGANMRRVTSADAVALTFDDGPDPAITPAVLDILDRAGAKATFFCIGRKVEAHPELAAEISRRGHDLQNHSHTHPNLFALQRPSKMEKEIAAAQDQIERASGVRPRFFRAPAGMQNPWMFPVLNRAGLSLVSWTRRGFDTSTKDAAKVAARLTRNLRAGDILVLHDRVPVVLEALPLVLDAIAKKGLGVRSLL